MIVDYLTMPEALIEAHKDGFDYKSGDGVDFEPYADFLTAAETTDWWRAWTGNRSLDGAQFRIFGQDGTGGLAGFWLIRPGEPLTRQPIVFLGSEGETAVLAKDLDSYLWLLAAGFGPVDIVYPEREPEADARLTELAERHASSSRQSAAEVIAAARAEFPAFDSMIKSLCR